MSCDRPLPPPTLPEHSADCDTDALPGRTPRRVREALAHIAPELAPPMAQALPSSTPPGSPAGASPSAPASAPASEPGASAIRKSSGPVIPGYQIVELLGRGGMGTVYKAHQSTLERDVAIKILAPIFTEDSEFLERFAREGRVMSALHHPGIVAVHDKGVCTSGHYIVMELVAGNSLRDEIQDGALTPIRSVGIAIQLLSALGYAHKQGVIHRDLKPDNILLQGDGSPKITDFGIAGLASWDDSELGKRLTSTGVAMGTRGYMAPEQMADTKRVDSRADLYSLGGILYEMLTGEMPLGALRFPAERGIRIDPRIDDVIKRLLRPDRNERYQSAEEALVDLEQIAKDGYLGRPTPTRPMFPAKAVPAPASSPAEAASGSFVLKGLAVAVVVALGIVGGNLLVRSGLHGSDAGMTGGHPSRPYAAQEPTKQDGSDKLHKLELAQPGAPVSVGHRIVVVGGGGARDDGVYIAMDPGSPEHVVTKLNGTPGGLAAGRKGEDAFIGLTDQQLVLHVDIGRNRMVQPPVHIPIEPTSIGVLEDGTVLVAGAGGNGVILSSDLRGIDRLNVAVDRVYVPDPGKVALLATSSTLACLTAADVAGQHATGVIRPSHTSGLAGIAGLATDQRATRVFATIPARGEIAVLGIPRLEAIATWKVEKLGRGQPSMAGDRLCVPTEDGVAWLTAAGTIDRRIATGQGAKDCLALNGHLWVSAATEGFVAQVE